MPDDDGQLSLDELAELTISGLEQNPPAVDFVNDGENTWPATDIDWGADDWNLPELGDIFKDPESGTCRWNFDQELLEIYDGSSWHVILTAEEVKRIHERKTAAIQRTKKHRFHLMIQELSEPDDKEVKEIKEVTAEQTKEIIKDVIKECRKNLLT